MSDTLKNTKLRKFQTALDAERFKKFAHFSVDADVTTFSQATKVISAWIDGDLTSSSDPSLNFPQSAE